MKKIFISLFVIIFLFFTLVSAQTNLFIYYKLNIHYDRGSLEIKPVEIEILDNKIQEKIGLWMAETKDDSNLTLNLTFFDVNEEYLWDGINSETGKIEYGGIGNISEFDFELMIPYFAAGKEIIIYNEQLDEITIVNVSMFSNNFENKMESMKQGDELIRGEKIEKETKKKFNFSEFLTEYLWVLLIIWAVLIIILVISFIKKKFTNTKIKRIVQ